MIFSKKDNSKAFILGLNIPKVTAYCTQAESYLMRWE